MTMFEQYIARLEANHVFYTRVGNTVDIEDGYGKNYRCIHTVGLDKGFLIFFLDDVGEDEAIESHYETCAKGAWYETEKLMEKFPS